MKIISISLWGIHSGNKWARVWRGNASPMGTWEPLDQALSKMIHSVWHKMNYLAKQSKGNWTTCSLTIRSMDEGWLLEDEGLLKHIPLSIWRDAWQILLQVDEAAWPHPCRPRSVWRSEFVLHSSSSFWRWYLEDEATPGSWTWRSSCYLLDQGLFSKPWSLLMKGQFLVDQGNVWFLCVCAQLLSCVWLSLPATMECSLPGSSVHGIFQPRILQWVATSYSRESSWPRELASLASPALAGGFFTTWESFYPYLSIIQVSPKSLLGNPILLVLRKMSFSCRFDWSISAKPLAPSLQGPFADTIEYKSHRETFFLAHHLCSLCTVAPRFFERNLKKDNSSLLAATAAKSPQ